MKLLHIGDLHIGKFVHEFSMLKDQEHILNQIIEIADKEQIDGILIAGDIYDRSIPPAEAVSTFDTFLTRLIKRNKLVCMISGNHDSPERIGFAEQILEKSGLHIVTSAKEGLKKIICKDAYGEVNVYFLPFAKPALMKYWIDEAEEKQDKLNKTKFEQKKMEEESFEKNEIKGEKRELLEQAELKADYDGCIKSLIQMSKIRKQERNILITHHFVVKGKDKPILSDSETSMSVGGIEQVNGDLFDEFDYVALGHIHRPQKVGRETMRYCGSPLKYSFSEALYDKSVTVVELKEKGNVEVKQISLKPLHDIRVIKGRLKDLIEETVVTAADNQDYIQAILTDEEALFEPMSKLRLVYPNIMQMIKEKDRIRDGKMEFDSISLEKKDSFQLYKEFFEAVTDRTLEEEREQIIKKIIEEVTEGDR